MVARHFFATVADYDNWVSDPVTYPPAETIGYVYDALGRVVEVDKPSDGVTTYQYATECRAADSPARRDRRSAAAEGR